MLTLKDFQKNPILSWLKPMKVKDEYGNVSIMPSKSTPPEINRTIAPYWSAEMFGMTYKNPQVKIVRHGTTTIKTYSMSGYNGSPGYNRDYTRIDGKIKIIVSLTGKVGEQKRLLKDGDIIFRGTESLLRYNDWQNFTQAVEEAKYVLTNWVPNR